jgi:hypothetical protein
MIRKFKFFNNFILFYFASYLSHFVLVYPIAGTRTTTIACDDVVCLIDVIAKLPLALHYTTNAGSGSYSVRARADKSHCIPHWMSNFPKVEAGFAYGHFDFLSKGWQRKLGSNFTL